MSRHKPTQIKPVDATGATVADGTYSVAVVGGVATGLVASASAFIPLVTIADGTPGLVFDDDGQIVYMES